MARSQMSREKDGVFWLAESRLAGGLLHTQSRRARQGEAGRSMDVPAAGLGSVSGCRLEALDGETGWLGWAGGEPGGKAESAGQCDPSQWNFSRNLAGLSRLTRRILGSISSDC